jgi:hypothetical protein
MTSQCYPNKIVRTAVNNAFERMLRAGVRYEPRQRFLTPEEIAAGFVQFRCQRPIFGRMVARIPGWNIDSTYEEFLELARTLRGVAFEPKVKE